MKRDLNPKERKKLGKLMAGKKDIGSDASQKFLNQEHVAIAFEKILENAGLSDEVLAKRLGEIVEREAHDSSNAKTGTSSTNQAAIDANAHNTIRTIFQIRGRFVEKVELDHRGAIGDMTDEQLDKLLESGGTFLKFNKSQITHDKHNKDDKDDANKEEKREIPFQR